MKNTQLFNIALITLLLYELFMISFGFQGVSVFKLIITILVWISFFTATREFFTNYRRMKKRVPYFPFFLITVLLLWNVISVFRSIVTRDDTITTILGNVFTSLALMVPLAVIFAMHKSNIKILQRYFFMLLKIGIPIFVVFFIITGSGFNDFTLRTLLLLFTPIVFLIAVAMFQKKKNWILILIGAILLFFVASRAGVRTMMIRELLLATCLVILFLYHKFKTKIVLFTTYLALLVPLVLLVNGMATGISPFETYLAFSDDDNLSVDTRTFLYNELYTDLVESNRLAVGKGATGKYYSDYFSTVEGDSPIRINVEVGILSILLKGGLFALGLHIAILFIAVFYSFFRSNNSYVVGIGLIVLIHTILMFIENIIIYNTYNFLIWFCVGICLSKEIRQMNNLEIKRLLK